MRRACRLFFALATIAAIAVAIWSAPPEPSVAEWQSWGAETDWELSAIAHLLLQGEPRAQLFRDVVVLPLREANAFVNPDGWLLVTEGLLERLDGRDEIAFVLAHELAHLIKGHPRNLETNPTRLERIRTEVERGLGTSVVGTGLQVLVNAIASYYSREREREADEEAIRLMAKAGFDLTAAERALKRLSDERGFLSWFRSHPFLAERVEIVQRAVREWRSKAVPPPSLVPPSERAPEVFVELQIASWRGAERGLWQEFANEVQQWFWDALMEATKQGTCPFYPAKRWQRHRAVIWRLQVTPLSWQLSPLPTLAEWQRWEVRTQWLLVDDRERRVSTEERFSTTFSSTETARSAILSSAPLFARRLAKFVVQHCQEVTPLQAEAPK